MKHCPTCGSSYTDDTLVYCLQDGATLQRKSEETNPLSMVATLRGDTQTQDASSERIHASSAPTVEIPQSALPTALYGEARPTALATGDAAPVTQPANTTRVILMTVVATVLLLGLGGVGVWMLFRGDGSAGERRDAQSNSNTAGPADTSNEANASNAAQPNNQTRGENRADKGGRWFVILGSYPKDEVGRAAERMDVLRKQGFDSRVVSSDDYPNFRSGLWLVVMGPYTRNKAEEVLEQVRPKVKDAYTKSGW